MANPAPLNSPFPLNDTATPLYGGVATSTYTYTTPSLPDGDYTLVVTVKNSETVLGVDSQAGFTINTADTGGFTDLFDGVGILLETALVPDASDNNPVWTDITHRMRSVDFHRGRQRELERWEPGTLTAILDNRDRALDPNIDPTVAPMRRVRLRAQYGGNAFDLWYGFADSWPQAWQLPNDAYVTLTATDAFKVFANATVFPSAYYSAVIDAGPLAYYRLNEKTGTTMVDSGGLRLNGTYSQPTTTAHSTVGLVAYDDDAAIAFNGSDDHATIPSTAHIPSYPFTLEGWFQTTDASAPLWYQTNGDTDYYAQLYLFGGVLLASVNSPSSNIYTKFAAGGSIGSQSSTSTNADGNPHHFLVRFTAHNVAPIIYIDGVNRTASPTVSGVAEVPTGAAFLGHEKHAGARYTGTLDEFAIYAYDLGTTAAAAHYAAATNPWAGDTSGQRIWRILDAIGWPAGDRESIALGAYPGGNTTVAVQDLRGKTALESILQVVETENGAGFIAANGKFHFRERHAIYLNLSTPVGIFGDDPANPNELPWSNLVLSSSDELIRNDVQVTTSTNLSAQVEDAASIAQYLRFTFAKSDLLLTNTEETYDLAYSILNRYSQPLQRVESIDIDMRHPKNPAQLWNVMFACDLESRLNVRRRPPGGGPPISQDVHIESIAMTIDPLGDWKVTYQLSPAQTAPVWIWGEAIWNYSQWTF